MGRGVGTVLLAVVGAVGGEDGGGGVRRGVRRGLALVVAVRALETFGRGGGPEDVMSGLVVLGLVGTFAI